MSATDAAASVSSTSIRAGAQEPCLWESATWSRSRALGRDARLRILDEPTAARSETEIQHVLAAIRGLAGEATSVLFVSHRLGEVPELCDNITVLREGHHVATPAGQGLQRKELAELILGHPHEPVPPVHLVSDSMSALVSIRNLRVPPRATGFDMDLVAGQVVALAGQIGSGSEDVLRGIAGLVHGTQGTVELAGPRVRTSWPHLAFRDRLSSMSYDRKSEGLFLGGVRRLPGLGELA